MPSNVKRLISHCNHNYHKRYYLFPPSQRVFYRYYRNATSAYQLATKQHQKYSVVNIIPDEDDGTAKTPNICDSIYIKSIHTTNREHEQFDITKFTHTINILVMVDEHLCNQHLEYNMYHHNREKLVVL